MDTTNPKQAIVDKVKKSNSILVTVARDPSVDALAAALGFTIMLNKYDKSATALFSGAIPPAISFLEPEKTFTGALDSLRDFIIALDKDKADRLRYKVEGDVVRIYITPYRTNISEKDLDYSMGEFNIDLIIALGVEKKSDLDEAIAAHGRILHDATIVTINRGAAGSDVGSLNWQDEKASSLCEMLMHLSESLQAKLIDQQIATALLTGIVAATNRFSNEYTTPRVMTLAAQLMAEGANQQLIAEKLEFGGALDQPQRDTPSMPVSEAVPVDHDDGVMHVEHVEETPPAEPQSSDKSPSDKGSSWNDTPQPAPQEEQAAPAAAESTETPINQDDVNDRLEVALGHIQPLEEFQQHVQEAKERAAYEKTHPPKTHSSDWRDKITVNEPIDDKSEPLIGGTLNATTSQAEADKMAEIRASRNHTILSHDAPPASNPFASSGSGKDEAEEQFDPFAGAARQQQDAPAANSQINSGTHGRTILPTGGAPEDSGTSSGLDFEETPLPPLPGASASQQAAGDAPSLQDSTIPDNPTIADLEAEVHAAAASHPATSSIDDARAAVNSAFSQPPSADGQPATADPLSINISSDGELTLPKPPEALTAAPPPVAESGLPPMPDFSTLPPLPPDPAQSQPAMPPSAPPQYTPPAATESPAPAAPPTPGQFQIPGQ